jgi:hypothetical protein
MSEISEARIAEIRERADAAIADYNHECENASDAGERTDLWEDVVEIPISDITDLLAALDAATAKTSRIREVLRMVLDDNPTTYSRMCKRALAAEAERDRMREVLKEIARGVVDISGTAILLGEPQADKAVAAARALAQEPS